MGRDAVGGTDKIRFCDKRTDENLSNATISNDPFKTVARINTAAHAPGKRCFIGCISDGDTGQGRRVHSSCGEELLLFGEVHLIK